MRTRIIKLVVGLLVALGVVGVSFVVGMRASDQTVRVAVGRDTRFGRLRAPPRRPDDRPTI